MRRPQRHDLEDQHVEGALQEVGLLTVGDHTKTLYMCICRMSRY
jgi:hypothetical protein